MRLHDLHPAPGAVKNRKRVGRGPGSGHGKTACRGSKGQKSRSGFSRKYGFEGGQMPLSRRVPKRGFHNPFRKEYAVVNLGDLDRRFEAGAEVTPEILVRNRMVRDLRLGVKILGNGEITKPLVVSAHQFSQSAKSKIETAGGSVKVLGS
jgi:large subunit ribosomal protein L15